MAPKLAFLACLTATLVMTGVIWFVHVVHYPLFGRVGADGFRAYHADHTRLTGRVVLVPMVVELLSSAWLAWDRPAWLAPGFARAGLALAALTWGITFFLSVPAHNHLAGGFDAGWHGRLVATNLARALAWTAHSAVLLAALWTRLD